MLFRFGVILTPECSDVEVLVSGSRSEMGSWDPNKAIQMKATQVVLSKHEPCLWIGEVQLSQPYTESAWFKFIKRLRGSYIWEGEGPHHDRCCVYDEMNVINGVYCHPLGHWIEETGHTDEMKHTTGFYLGVAHQKAMHFSRVHPRVWLGSCPRQVEHVTIKLKHELGVTAVMNFQTETDVATNCQGCSLNSEDPATTETMMQLYRDCGLASDPDAPPGGLPAPRTPGERPHRLRPL
ncbi:laforin isoform X2 [Gadus chalcogrammus]|uniref:laforin isoform X2 n=1 Tax=Gadus chalcogrammus TaxID=1042646 RepID=UPI0024C4A371|nr:laforin isoform X2 [Gadus chalcogrammus]